MILPGIRFAVISFLVCFSQKRKHQNHNCEVGTVARSVCTILNKSVNITPHVPKTVSDSGSGGHFSHFPGVSVTVRLQSEVVRLMPRINGTFGAHILRGRRQT